MDNKTKVYLVQCSGYEECDNDCYETIIGIFDTFEKAKEVTDSIESSGRLSHWDEEWVEIYEIEINKRLYIFDGRDENPIYPIYSQGIKKGETE